MSSKNLPLRDISSGHRDSPSPSEDNPDRRQSFRSSEISGKFIELTEGDPLDRLKQLGTQGSYKYHFNWDVFANGIMCELEITYLLTHQPTSRKTLIKEARFVKSIDINCAKRVLAAVVLEKLGLGVEETEDVPEYDETETKMREVAEKGLGMAMTALNRMMSEIPTGHK